MIFLFLFYKTINTKVGVFYRASPKLVVFVNQLLAKQDLPVAHRDMLQQSWGNAYVLQSSQSSPQQQQPHDPSPSPTKELLLSLATLVVIRQYCDQLNSSFQDVMRGTAIVFPERAL
jgi:hypothetical protein